MKIAIMQPYFFPYIGYFQLINAVDKFIFYDDVNFIKSGWINRNKILINHKTEYITVHLRNSSSNKLIKEIDVIDNRERLLKTIQMAYLKAPYFNQTWPIVKKCLYMDSKKISEIAIFSVIAISEYLNIGTKFEISSEKYPNTLNLVKADRLIEICKINKIHNYLNLIGGKELYSKEQFAKHKIQLSFLKPINFSYLQFGVNFTPWLSIIDVLMFNSKEKIIEILNHYEFE